MITRKRPDEIEKIRQSGQILAETFERISPLVCSGARTRDIDRAVEEFVLSKEAKPAFKGYRGFPASTCISVNEEVVHGIPSDKILCDGDIASIDIGVLYQNYFSDCAKTFEVGTVDAIKQKLVKITKESLFDGISVLKDGVLLQELSAAIQETVERNGFSVVRKFVGHGIGKHLHEEPQIPNYVSKYLGGTAAVRLRAGMVLAIEPMVNVGTYKVEIEDNQWTVVTKDGKPSAHFEHTVVITETGYEILTQ